MGPTPDANPFCLPALEAGGNGDFFGWPGTCSASWSSVRKEVFLQGNENPVLAIWASTSRREWKLIQRTDSKSILVAIAAAALFNTG
ncbi:MAG: hypothetical protein R3F43_29280 [bacterium]